MSVPARPQRYPCRSTFGNPSQCEFCGRPWTVIVEMLKKYKTWEQMPDCPKRPKRCPTCDSPAPHLHPAVQFEGEVEVCRDPFHLQPTPQNLPYLNEAIR